jgi:hypothetical protein
VNRAKKQVKQETRSLPRIIKLILTGDELTSSLFLCDMSLNFVNRYQVSLPWEMGRVAHPPHIYVDIGLETIVTFTAIFFNPKKALLPFYSLFVISYT